ncbi:MAG TPA: TraR/DksA C4-type zinc finger protein [Pirellulales bacterium]|jgi:DNA-directed RNA polymerase subunit M/transcription elongation factor TFIIS
MSTPEAVEVACTTCQWSEVVGPTGMLDWLRKANMLRRDVGPEIELLGELFRAAVARSKCPGCGEPSIVVRPVSESNEDWGMARACQECGRPIARERMEILPSATLCAPCQAGADRGESGPAEYCSKCGSVLVLKPRGGGITRYQMTCPQCRT